MQKFFGALSLIAFIASSSCFIVYRDVGMAGPWIGLALAAVLAWLARWSPAVGLDQVVEGQGGGQQVLTPELRAWLGGAGAQRNERLYSDQRVIYWIVAFALGLAGLGWLLLIAAPKLARAPVPLVVAGLVVGAVLWPSGLTLYRWLRAPLRPGIWLRDGHILLIASFDQFVCRDLAADLVTSSRAETRRDERPVTNLHLLFREDGPHPPVLLLSVNSAPLARRLAEVIERAQERAAEAHLQAERAAAGADAGDPYRAARPPAQVATRDLLLRLWSAGAPPRRVHPAFGILGLAVVLAAATWAAGLAQSQARALARCETVACYEEVGRSDLFRLRHGQARRGVEGLYRQASARAQNDPPALRRLATESLSWVLQGTRRQAVERAVREGSRERLRALCAEARDRLASASGAGPAALRSILASALHSAAYRLRLTVDSQLQAPNDPRQLGPEFGQKKTVALAPSFGWRQLRAHRKQLAERLQSAFDGLTSKGLLEVVESTPDLARSRFDLAALSVSYRVEPTEAVYHSNRRPLGVAFGKPEQALARYRTYYRGLKVHWRVELAHPPDKPFVTSGAATPSPRFTVRGGAFGLVDPSADTVYSGMLGSALQDLAKGLRAALAGARSSPRGAAPPAG